LTVMLTATIPIAEQHRAVSHGCGLIDRSERGKLALTGTEASEMLNGLVSNDVLSLQAGGGCYAALLTPKGRMLGDLRVLAAPKPWPALVLDTERVALQSLFDALRRGAVGYDVELHKATLQRGLLSLVGPQAAAVTGAPEAATLTGEHTNAAAVVAGIEVLLVATDTGLDLLCEASQTAALGAALVESGALPVVEEVAEVLRVQRGRPRYGVDLDDTTIPQEAGLNARAVSFTKGCYVGQETVARLHYRGRPTRRLCGVRLSAPARSGDRLALGTREVGHLGSVVLSPQLGWIALALVRREAEIGAVLEVGEDGLTGDLVELPFGEESAA